jgi:hypothetical protein
MAHISEQVELWRNCRCGPAEPGPRPEAWSLLHRQYYERRACRAADPARGVRRGPRRGAHQVPYFHTASTLLSRSARPQPMTAKGQEDQFRPPGLSGGYRLSEATFARTVGKEEDAPFPDLPLSSRNGEVRPLSGPSA